MDNHNKTEGVIFEQICAVNELDPQVIRKEAQERFPDKYSQVNNEELLIWTAFDYKAKSLLSSIEAVPASVSDEASINKLYAIDGDPAAPGFMINEDTIHHKYDKEIADKLIDALGQVKLPIRA